MEWDKILAGILSTTPVGTMCAFAVYKLWSKLEVKDLQIQKLTEAKEADCARHAAELAEINRHRLDDLQAILRRGN